MKKKGYNVYGEWSDGGMEEWKNGVMEEWSDGAELAAANTWCLRGRIHP